LYSVRILRPAVKELEKLDPSISKRIVNRIEWLSQNLDSTKVFPLKGELKGLYIKFEKVRIESYLKS